MLSVNRMSGVMSRAAAMLLLSLALQMLAFTGTASGQGTSLPRKANPADSPYQQRLSPYLDLFRADASLLSPYHSFVVPRREVRQQLRRQSYQINRLQQQAVGLESRLDHSPGTRLPTGRGGSFNNYLHYYRLNHPPQN